MHQFCDLQKIGLEGVAKGWALLYTSVNMYFREFYSRYWKKTDSSSNVRLTADAIQDFLGGIFFIVIKLVRVKAWKNVKKPITVIVKKKKAI